MTIFRCLHEIDAWSIGFYVLGGLFGAIFIFALIPSLIYVRTLFAQKKIVFMTQLSVLFALLLKNVTFGIATYLQPLLSEDKLSFFGLIMFETPCYVMVTCYTLTLLSWLSVCLVYLPPQYHRFSKIAVRTFIALNCIIYITFVLGLIIEVCNIGSNSFQSRFSTAIIALRDIIIGIAFMIFIRFGFGITSFFKVSSQEKMIFVVNLSFGILLLLRAIIVIVQEFFKEDKEKECSITFFYIFIFNEIIIDLIPLSVIIFLHTNHIISRSRMQILPATEIFINNQLLTDAR